jgi:hypothetical protein
MILTPLACAHRSGSPPSSERDANALIDGKANSAGDDRVRYVWRSGDRDRRSRLVPSAPAADGRVISEANGIACGVPMLELARLRVKTHLAATSRLGCRGRRRLICGVCESWC